MNCREDNMYIKYNVSPTEEPRELAFATTRGKFRTHLSSQMRRVASHRIIRRLLPRDWCRLHVHVPKIS